MGCHQVAAAEGRPALAAGQTPALKTLTPFPSRATHTRSDDSLRSRSFKGRNRQTTCHNRHVRAHTGKVSDQARDNGGGAGARRVRAVTFTFPEIAGASGPPLTLPTGDSTSPDTRVNAMSSSPPPTSTPRPNGPSRPGGLPTAASRSAAPLPAPAAPAPPPLAPLAPPALPLPSASTAAGGATGNGELLAACPMRRRSSTGMCDNSAPAPPAPGVGRPPAPALALWGSGGAPTRDPGARSRVTLPARGTDTSAGLDAAVSRFCGVDDRADMGPTGGRWLPGGGNT